MPPNEPRKTSAERAREAREQQWADETATALVAAEQHEPNTACSDSLGRILSIVANRLDARADLVAELKRSGWKARENELRQASAEVDSLLFLVGAWKPPAPVREPAAIGGGNGSVADLDARLTTAFGPELHNPDSPDYDAWSTHSPDHAAWSAQREQIESEVDGPTLTAATIVEPVLCTNGPACPVHPDIEVLHPADAPTDAVVGPEGGTDPLPTEEDPIVTQPLPPMPPPVPVQMPAFTDPGTAPRPRLTYPELYARAASAVPEDHRSVSQIQTAAECGVKLALYREPERVPSWWNVAGTALHTCVELYERVIIDEGMPAEIEPWLPTFFTEIEKVRTATGIPVDRWRAARGGSEGYDWWRVQGEEFLKTYVAWSQKRHAEGWHILTIGDTPVIEYPFQLDVAGVRVDGVIDQAWVGNGIEIIDMKFGSSRPADRFQLGVYAHAVAQAMDTAGWPEFKIGGAYYLGRKGEPHGATDDLRAAVPWADVVHRTWMTEQMARAQLFMPNRTSFCGACGVADLCPAGAS